MDRHLGGQFPYAAFFWPALAAMSAVETASFIAGQFLGVDADGDRAAQEPEGATPSKIALELHTVRLRDFTVVESGVPTLLCAPLALHGAVVADLATGHSLVAALRAAGIERLFMADWRSASPEMRFLGIDDYLADLNLPVDHLGGLVDFVRVVAAAMEGLIRASKVKELIVVAPPRTLAELRLAFHPDVKSCIVAEVNKDLTKHPIIEIERHLTGSIASH
jgi:hypothetical protein